jgi:hypothetical protein
MSRFLKLDWKRAALNAVILFHVVLLFMWGLPNGPFRRALTRPFERYVLYAGLWHSSNMFASSVPVSQLDLRANVKYRDGSEAEWIAPRLQDMSHTERMVKARWRKWRLYQLNNQYAPAWNCAARFVAREMNTKLDNPPVQVSMVRYSAPTPPINKKRDYQPPLRWPIAYSNSTTYVVCRISPKDL